MNEKSIHWFMVGGIALLLVIALLQFGEPEIVIGGENVHKISVSGNAEKEVMPDEAVLTLSVLTDGKEAKATQEQNSEVMKQVMAALKEVGVPEKQIETVRFSLSPWEEWDSTSEKNVHRGYKVQHTIAVTTKDVRAVGALLDVAVKNGINTIDTIAFAVSDATEKEVKATLVKEASAQARLNAKNLAQSLDVSLGDVLYITESSYSGGPWYFERKSMLMEASASTQINPESVKVSLQVNVDFEID